MKPRFVSRHAFIVVGLKYRGATDGGQLPALWQAFNPRRSEINAALDSPESFGITHNFDHATNEFDYFAAIAVSQKKNIPSGMELIELPAQDYAVFDCTLQSLMETIQAIHSDWLPNSKHQRAPGPEFELYDENWNPDEGAFAMSIWIPILKSNK